MIKFLTSYLQLDELIKNKEKLIFLFASNIPAEIIQLLQQCLIDVIVIDFNIFEALNKKYHVKQDLTLVFLDNNFVIYQTSDKQAIVNFLKLKEF